MQHFFLHLVSDSTGETLRSVARACIAQFDDIDAVERTWSQVRTDRQLERVIRAVEEHPGPVLYTLVNTAHNARLREACRKLKIPAISIITPAINRLAAYLGTEAKRQPGSQHTLNEAYFDRMDAMDFALSHDDGRAERDLNEANVILVGISRTSKTPTCIYLANQGIKAANIPYVPGVPMPEELVTLEHPLYVGLTEAPERLIEIRRNRIRLLKSGEKSDYLDPEKVHEEVREARRYYTRMGWPVIDVTRRSVEETAAEIMSLLERRKRKRREAMQKQSGEIEKAMKDGDRDKPKNKTGSS